MSKRQPALRPVEILLVEDNPGHILLTREALKDHKVTNRLHIVQDGEEALAFLRREGRYADAIAPDLILLDLNLPKMDGREVLAALQTDERLRRIPVVILTSSKTEQEVLETYHLNANCYLTKPVDLPQLLFAVQSFEGFQFQIVKSQRSSKNLLDDPPGHRAH